MTTVPGELVMQYRKRGTEVVGYVELCSGKDKPHALLGILLFADEEQWQAARRAMRLTFPDGERETGGMAIIGGGDK